MTQSMTGFARRSGTEGPVTWAWEARSVNGRGLEVRVRLPDGFEVLEAPARAAVAARFKRGNVNLALKIKGSDAGHGAILNADALDAALRNLKAVEDGASAAGLGLAKSTPAEILRIPGVCDSGTSSDETALMDQVKAALDPLLDDLAQARTTEGAALRDVLSAQVEQVADLACAASDLLPQRRAHMEESLRANVARLLSETDALDTGRLEQELAVIAVKSDVAEELDRLSAHVTAARELLAAKGPVGRKFDFLTQEFNREANTLCAKAGFAELTALGLELKTVIDQMREQVQNVE